MHRFACELTEEKRLRDETYRKAAALLGDRGVVELVTLLGYYAMVSMILNAFRVPMPPDATPPFSGTI